MKLQKNTVKFKFSALISVYAKEQPEFFAQSLNSILTQTLVPDELIIVKDGPISEALEAVIAGVAFEGTLKVLSLSYNVTQGPARAEGILVASNDWIAIMDSDDICSLDRFEKQVALILCNPTLGIVGGQIDEFLEDPTRPVAVKSVPITHDSIYSYAKKRNPFNHMTIMLNRQNVLDAGNYQYFPYFEDYDLFVRMLNLGVKAENLSDVIVHARIGNGMHNRRRGLGYIGSELKMQKMMQKLNFISTAEFLRNLIIRIPVRLLPASVLERLYNRFAREVHS